MAQPASNTSLTLFFLLSLENNGGDDDSKHLYNECYVPGIVLSTLHVLAHVIPTTNSLK